MRTCRFPLMRPPGLWCRCSTRRGVEVGGIWGGAVRGGPGHDVVAEYADALDLGLDAVSGLQVELERVRLDGGHARDRPGGEDVPGRKALRRVVRDQVRDGDEHLGRI